MTKTAKIMLQSHFISADGEKTKGTHQYPANTGMYIVILSDGRTSVEAYTVALGWMRFPAWHVALSLYIGPLNRQ